MNDADETGDCMRSVRDSAQAGLTPAVFGGSFGSAECILEPADDSSGGYTCLLSPYRETTPRVRYREKPLAILAKPFGVGTVSGTDVEHERRFKVAARFSVTGGKIPETLPVMGCIMHRHPDSL